MATATKEPRTRKKGSPRIGRLTGGDGEPARFVESGDPPARPNFNAQEVAEGLGIWWKSGAGGSFVLGSPERGWSIWPEQGVIDLMRDRFCVSIKAREDELLSEAKQVFLWVRENRCLDEIFPAIAGYTSGVHRLQSGERVLVKTEPTLIAPKAGEWETIRAIIEGLLGDEQATYFYSWCQVAYMSLRDGRPGRRRPGHAMIIASPGGSGKSFLQNFIITPLLGGREADPQKFLFGTDDFNGDCFAAEHLCLAEVPSSQKTVDRIALAETIKQIVANPLQRMRLMRVEPWAVHPFWRLSITLNDEPDKLRSLPPITADYGDKVLIFHGRRNPMPMPTNTEEQRIAFTDQVESELGAFVDFLVNEWEIPADLLKYPDGKDATRFGFREYHHPLVSDGLFDETPAGELMMLIDQAEFEREGVKGLKLWHLESDAGSNAGVEGRVWHGRAFVLEALLKGEGGFPCNVAGQAKELFRHNRLSTLLRRLADHPELGNGKRIDKGDTRTWKGWLIGRPVDR